MSPFQHNLPETKPHALSFALIFAALFHLSLLWTFKTPSVLPTKITRTLDVTLSNQPLINSDSRQLRSEHQSVSSFVEKPASANKQSTASTKPIITSPRKPETLNHLEPKKIAESKSTPITANPAIISDISDNEQKPKISADELQQQISQLGKNIVNSAPSFEDKKIKLVNEIRSHKYLVNQYVQDWDDKIERTGNMNYPEAARNLKQAQTLTMEIGIKADGNIYSIGIVKSSGNTSLDEAARRIVKMSAPFAELPADLQREVNVLVITRVWKFSDETGMTTR